MQHWDLSGKKQVKPVKQPYGELQKIGNRKNGHSDFPGARFIDLQSMRNF
jgi:hypothetical protein